MTARFRGLPDDRTLEADPIKDFGYAFRDTRRIRCGI
jgi:hypothetical protein